MIGALYVASAASDANTGTQTEMLLTNTAAMISLVERAAISQGTQTTSEQEVAKISKWSIVGTGGDAVTEVALNDQAAAASGTVTIEGTIAVTTGTGTNSIFYQQGFNVLSGWLWTPANDDEVIIIGLSGVAELGLTTGTASLVWYCSLTWREYGT